ncbi:MAG: hypothetical protein WBA20_20160 [Ketobacter sp.]
MTNQQQNEEPNSLNFDFTPGPHPHVSPLIDDKNFFEEWDLQGRFIPLTYHELAVPLLALDDIYLQCESILIECFYLGSCGCGFTGCGAVMCDIKLEYGEMVWENFRTSGPSSLPHIGPFIFNWDQVVENLRKARDAHKNTLS